MPITRITNTLNNALLLCNRAGELVEVGRGQTVVLADHDIDEAEAAEALGHGFVDPDAPPPPETIV
jgi:hypothetical protein